MARLERAEASDTADPAIPFAMGNALAAYGRHEAAARAYRRAIAIDPCLSAAHANLGTAQHQLGFLDEAIRSYRRAIACDGAYAKAHLNLASALQERGDLASAIASLEAAHELRPDDAALASTLRELKEHAASQNQSQP